MEDNVYFGEMCLFISGMNFASIVYLYTDVADRMDEEESSIQTNRKKKEAKDEVT